jgi:hypothetical protein
MDHTLTIRCPGCQSVLIVDRITGEVLETRKPLVEDSTGDRFQDAVKKIKQDSQQAEAKFRQAKEAEKNKHADLDALFKKSMEQVKKEGPAAPDLRDIDLD